MSILMKKRAEPHQNFVNAKFLAPHIRGGKVRVQSDGFVKTYRPIPEGFEGWGVFRAGGDGTANLERNANSLEVGGYLKRLNRVRLILVQPLRHQTWLAYPVHSDSFRQEIGKVEPVTVYLVTLGRAFEQAVCRWDGSAFWFDRVDRAASPHVPRSMGAALRKFVSPEDLDFSGLTPELREAYRMIFTGGGTHRVRCSQERLQKALELGGGRLESFTDQGDHWSTSWTTSTDEVYTSSIDKAELTVLSAGVCLAEEDSSFDLSSLGEP